MKSFCNVIRWVVKYNLPETYAITRTPAPRCIKIEIMASKGGLVPPHFAHVVSVLFSGFFLKRIELVVVSALGHPQVD